MGQRIHIKHSNEPFDFANLGQWTGIQPPVIDAYPTAYDRGVYYDFPKGYYVILGSTISLASELKPVTTLPQQPIIDAFADHDDVNAIYLASRTPHKIVVLINHESYEREAMSELFARELNLLEQLKDYSVEVNFVPQLDRDPHDLMPFDAVELYTRA